MANIKSAQKRILVTAKNTAANRMIKSQLKTAIRRFEEALESENYDEAKTRLKFVEKKLYQAAAKGTIHKARASRKISRLAKRLNKAI
ncbi:MAG: 30S ribosomal protein S20 [Natronincolaceae bacterium]|nr:30S ribosomal protein S20 [Bacillota bacterium]NLK90189.1 30S ribosomal protein S20 [Clostridiales bacterium]